MSDHLDMPPDLLSRAIALEPYDQPSDGGPPTVPRREPHADHAGPKARKPGAPRRPPTAKELEVRAEIERYKAAMPTACGARCGRWVARDLMTRYQTGKWLCPACLEAALIAEREAVRAHERAAERRRTLARRAWAEMERVAVQNCPEQAP